MKDELSHVHADIEHVQRDIEAHICHLKNRDEHLHHLMNEADTKTVSPSC
ncbi:hypothetical protein [Methanospirillum lacunae]